MRKILFLSSAFALLIWGCSHTSTYIDRNEDKKQAQAVVDSLYKFLEAKNYHSTHSLFDSVFYKKTDTTTLDKSLEDYIDKAGEIKDFKPIASRSVIAESSFGKYGDYSFKYLITRKNYNTIETINLTTHKGKSQIKITAIGFDVVGSKM